MHELRCARIIRKYVAISPLESRTGHDGAKALIVVLSDPVANLNQPRLPICIRQRNTCVLLGTVGLTVEIVALSKRIAKVLGQLRGNGRFSAAGNTHDDDVSWDRWHAANSTVRIRGAAVNAAIREQIGVPSREDRRSRAERSAEALVQIVRGGQGGEGAAMGSVPDRYGSARGSVPDRYGSARGIVELEGGGQGAVQSSAGQVGSGQSGALVFCSSSVRTSRADHDRPSSGRACVYGTGWGLIGVTRPVGLLVA